MSKQSYLKDNLDPLLDDDKLYKILTVEDDMDEQEKKLEEEAPGTEQQPEKQEEQTESLKETTEKIWGSTKHAWSTATFKANQYKNLVQKKIDLSAIHKNINAAHGELGKIIDDLREAGQKNIMNQAAVKEILERIDELKAEAASLEEEVEKIRTEEVPQEELNPEEKTE
jgi:predicted  nucleic acid-binding Zn-ribbon protein